MARAIHISLALLAGLSCTSCFLWTTKNDGETIKQDMQHLEDRLSQVESETGERQQRLEEMIDRARVEVESLEETLTKATRVLARNSADFGAEMESLKSDMRSFKGTLAEIDHALDEMSRKVEESDRKVNEFAIAAGLDIPVDESRVPDKEGSHLDEIKKSLAAGRYGECRSLAKVFLERYPKSGDADEVQLLIARSYVEQKRWAKALGALRRFTDRYPKSRHAPEVLYEMANAFFQLGDCTDARILVEAIRTRHKGSPFAAKAEKLQQTMLKQKHRCTS